MSTVELQAIVRNCRAYKSGEVFRPSEVSSALSHARRETISTARTCEVLRAMVANGEIKRVGCDYQRARGSVNWLSVPFRKHSDAWCGVDA